MEEQPITPSAAGDKGDREHGETVQGQAAFPHAPSEAESNSRDERFSALEDMHACLQTASEPAGARIQRHGAQSEARGDAPALSAESGTPAKRSVEMGHIPYTVFGAIPEDEDDRAGKRSSADDASLPASGGACWGGEEAAETASCYPSKEDRPLSECSCSSGHNKDLGRRGEQAAARFLERRGMEILERNWVCAAGEADIIAHDGEAIHFVEVKTRSNIAHGFPSEAVTPEKRSRYERIAALYLSQNEYVDINVLFDIISIVVTGPNRAFLRFHRNAYASCD